MLFYIYFQQHPTNEHCNFIYNITQDLKYQFRLQGREEWYIGFKLKKVRHSIRGKALPGYKKNKDGRFKHCFDFTLIPVDKNKVVWKPNFFSQVGDDYNPEKPFRSNRHRDKSGHRIRHASHRKMLRRRKSRKRNRKSRKRKPASWIKKFSIDYNIWFNSNAFSMSIPNVIELWWNRGCDSEI